MNLSDLTDPDAVLSAIREFDRLGRAAFLAKHGFRPARSYFLLHGDRLYDSKAIAGVAVGIQHPSHGTLEASQFSGGRDTVQRVLEGLGFNVTDGRRAARVPRVWAFCANPSRYRIRDAVKHLDLDRWSVSRGDVRKGDRALIWQTADAKGRRGVVALGEIITDPVEMPDLANPFWVDPSEGTGAQRRVEVRYLVPPGLPRWIDDPELGSLLRGLAVARARGGTVFGVTQDQWTTLQRFLEVQEPSPEALEAEEVVRHRSSSRRGQGFGLSAEDRAVVEVYAMGKAVEYLSTRWAEVTDVSGNSSFDLHCKDASKELRVEVKGTTSLGDEIVLTRNEVEQARHPGYALFVVSEISLVRSEVGASVARGGICRYFDPWTAAEEDLKPISYRCALDLSAGRIVR